MGDDGMRNVFGLEMCEVLIHDSTRIKIDGRTDIEYRSCSTTDF